MLKLIKHLRPFYWWIAAIFVLLFAQAMADLSLPGYMSNIVNVGIQQNGVQNAVPEAIRASEFSRLTLFMTDAEKAQIAADYTLLDRQSLSAADYAKYVKSYPALSTVPICRLNTKDKNETAQLDGIFRKYMPIVAGIERNGLSILAPDLPPLPAGVDLFAAIAQFPPAEFDALRNAVSTQISYQSSTMLKQFSIAYVSSEYKAIGMDVGSIQNHYLIHVGMLMLLLTLVSVACAIAVGYLSTYIAAALGRNMRKGLFGKVESFSNTEFDKFSTASLITRTTNDITQIQMVMVMMFRFVFYAPILGIGGIIKVLNADRVMLAIIAAAVAFMLAMMIVVFVVALPKFRSMQGLIDRLNLVMREMLTGLMVIRAFNTQKREEEKFDTANTDLTKTGLFVNRIMVSMMPIIMLLMNGVMLLIVWVGAHQVDAGTTQVGDLIAFMQYGMLIIFSFIMVSLVFIMLPRASISAQRISEVLETDPVITDPVQPQKFDGRLQGTVEFQDVSFRYPGAEDDVLKHITFTARPGQMTAFIGSTGSGKTTLVTLILRFYDVKGGRVLVDGIDVRQVTQHDLRDKIGYVPQKSTLFSGTIESNIKYADENASREEVAACAATAQALDFITASDQGYATIVSQGGSNLSGGQQQRLSIARALARKPEIYIFDDSFSALDFKTDAALRKALREKTANATVIIVTQRISTIMGADQIVVLDNGNMAGVGTHNELMKTCDVYRELASSQMSKEEMGS